ncbi:MAG: hypothetical protein LBN02_10120 [Oscillospiraceae bacterium]|jgi:hypothetical protein|nr:hypothetical protein [Oscillospiraceae bacterium]
MPITLLSLFQGLTPLKRNLLLLAIPVAVLAVIVAISYYRRYRRRTAYKNTVAEFIARHNGAARVYFATPNGKSDVSPNHVTHSHYQFNVLNVNDEEPLWIYSPHTGGVSHSEASLSLPSRNIYGFYAASGVNLITAECYEFMDKPATTEKVSVIVSDQTVLSRSINNALNPTAKNMLTREFVFDAVAVYALDYDGANATLTLAPI